MTCKTPDKLSPLSFAFPLRLYRPDPSTCYLVPLPGRTLPQMFSRLTLSPAVSFYPVVLGTQWALRKQVLVTVYTLLSDPCRQEVACHSSVYCSFLCDYQYTCPGKKPEKYFQKSNCFFSTDNSIRVWFVFFSFSLLFSFGGSQS